ncbi:MAG: hypothetical protein V4585_08290 [Bacteroidota bacterium]
MSQFSNIVESNVKKNWQLLAQEIGGVFVDGGFWNKDKVILKYGKTKIVLGTHTINTGKSNTKYTRMKSQFTSTSGFTFSISSENFFTHLVKKIGFNDIEIGEFEFDDRIYVKSNDKQKVKSFFVSSIVKENTFKVVNTSESILSIKRHDSLFFFAESDVPNPFYVVLTKLGVESDTETLKSWFTLCKLTLDRLIEIGEAEDINPNIQ